MRKTTVAAIISVPLLVAACIYGLYRLMTSGYLQLTAYLLIGAVGLMLLGGLVALFRRHKAWGALLVVGALLTAAVVGTYGLTLNNKLDNIARAKDDVLSKGKRPAKKESRELNILLLGADQRAGSGPTIAEQLADGTWSPGSMLSDTIMVVHIPADRSSAQLVSVPRDSYVPIYDGEGVQHGENKVNAAFSLYGPFGTWRTIENLSGLHIDHMAIIDFVGFQDLTTAIGGVDVYVPETVYDNRQSQEWTQGWHHIEGELALKYVRQRHGLANSDFDRVARQQNFLRAVMEKVLADDTIGDPLKLPATLEALTSNLTVDESWSNQQIRGLAVSMRNLSLPAVRFMTIPLDRFETIQGAGAVNIIDETLTQELFDAVNNNATDAFLTEHPDVELGAPDDVS